MLNTPAHLQSGNRGLPRRVDSLVASKAPYFIEIEDELRDIRRVNAQGQEEDLRFALTRMISRVEELTSMLKDAYKAQTDMQTELTLARSNLQLALANNEMLEDALKRDAAGSARDIGWRRWSAKEQKEREAEEDRRRSIDSPGFDTGFPSPAIPSAHPSPAIASPHPRSATIASPSAPDNRFFNKLRFGGGTPTTQGFPASPRLPSASGRQSPSVNGQFHASHLTSASLPSLVAPRDRDKELEDLAAELKREREARKVALQAKETLEAELESLSQALFEEANKMVSTERRKLAETEDELREARAEREALRSALRLVEGLKDRGLDSGTHPLSLHVRAESNSSAVAIKSPPTSTSASPSSAKHLDMSESDDFPTSAGTVVASAYPQRPQPLSLVEPASPLVSSPEDSAADLKSFDIPHKSSIVDVSPSPSVFPLPSPAPSPRPPPSPLPGQYVLPRGRSVDYMEGEDSPWADVHSAGSSPNPVA
ncbi:hypothetical protein B0H21DRAFT_165737 [Amylocystis lapponica]|nr:hypothetical protein B0H21DRAFT_165737 [Amylocystis lapponica]